MYFEIDIENEYGNLQGYSVSAKDENYKEFLKKELSNEKISKKIIEYIEKNIEGQINIIRNINVDEEHRGNGIGQSMLQEALFNCEIAILISDKYEQQLNGLKLDDFYSKNNFGKTFDAYSGSLMIFPKQTALEIKNELNKLNKKNKLRP